MRSSHSGLLRSADWQLVYRRFGTTYPCHLQGSRARPLTIDLWRWDRKVVSKRRELTTDLRCVTSQKFEDLSQLLKPEIMQLEIYEYCSCDHVRRWAAWFKCITGTFPTLCVSADSFFFYTRTLQLGRQMTQLYQSLYYPTNAHNVKNVELLKHIKIIEAATTRFG